MPGARSDNTKKDIIAVAATYGIEVVGFLGLDGLAGIPADEIDLLKGVKWADTEVDISNVKNPVEIMPAARTLIILGKRLMDDGQDVYYRVSGDYTASVEMMVLDIASSRVIDSLEKNGFKGQEYTSYYLKAWAVLAGLGWIGKSRMFVSKEHGPRLRLRGVLTDADMGEPCEVLSDDSCGECAECIKACPVGAIGECEVDRKKCGACPLNHYKITAYAYSYCTACTSACPVGASRHDGQKQVPQAISRQRITP
jgi:epoxyqueuosine reductase